MNMFLFKIGASIVGCLLLVAAVIGAYEYVTGIKEDLQTSQQNVQLLKNAVQDQQALINSLKADQKQIAVAQQTITNQMVARAQEIQTLTKRLNNLATKALSNPTATEMAINKGTANAIRCMEIASGSPLTEAEKNANTIDQINKECPDLANPAYKP